MIKSRGDIERARYASVDVFEWTDLNELYEWDNIISGFKHVRQVILNM